MIEFRASLAKFAFRPNTLSGIQPTTTIHLKEFTPGNRNLIERAGHSAKNGHPLHMNGSMYMVTRIGWEETHNRYPVIELKELI